MKKIVLSIIALSLFSCDNYLDVNQSPNSPSIDDITPSLALRAAQSQTYRMISGDNRNFETSIRSESANQLGNIMMNSWAGNVRGFTNPYSSEYRSIITSTFYDNIWNYGYRNIANFQNIIDYSSNNYDNHKAIAMILKSFYMQIIVDLYGDCPYREAFKGQDLLYPKYDDDKQIYRDLYTQLEDAITLIENADSGDASVGSDDCMYAGNMQSWIRFANTVKLKLLVRQSAMTDTETVTYVTTKLTQLAADNNFIVNDVTLNPGYSLTSNDQQNPFYGAYGYNISAQALTSRTLVVASKHVANKLNVPADPRRDKLFTLVGTSVVGTEQGEDSSTAPLNSSLLGSAYIPAPPVGATHAQILAAVTAGSTANSIVMTLAESKFLLAEMAVRYPSVMSSFNAQALFEEGIQASFTSLGAGSATSYITAINATTDGRSWTGTANKIEPIMYQKWIATMHINAQESWIDYVRTGFPVTPLAITNGGVGKPKRLLYPFSEYVANSQNVPTQQTSAAFATGPFWIN